MTVEEMLNELEQLCTVVNYIETADIVSIAVRPAWCDETYPVNVFEKSSAEEAVQAALAFVQSTDWPRQESG